VYSSLFFSIFEQFLLDAKDMRTFLLVFIFLSTSTFAQSSQDSVHTRKLNNFLIISGIAYGAALTSLSEVWYKNQEKQPFRFFDDSQEWQQMDKAGHFYSAFHLSQVSAHFLHNAGLPTKKSYLFGSLAGAVLLLPIEIFDGFSSAYGASWSDLAANTLGASFFLGQSLLWQEVRIHPKFSFHQTEMAPLRPNTLGHQLHEEFLKDYNGQTYWLSLDLYSFMKSENKFPKWLNIAVGYGANNMLYARQEQNLSAGQVPYRQFYLALDLDLSHYRLPPTRFTNKILNGALYVVNMVHLPAPTVSFSQQQGFQWHWMYF
jgi:VanZ family protein